MVRNKLKPKSVTIYTFFYTVLLMMPAILGLSSRLFKYFFYGRFLFFGIVTLFLFLLIKPHIARWDRLVFWCWFFTVTTYLFRHISILKLDGILFSISMIWHGIVFMTLFNSRSLVISARKGTIIACIFMSITSLVLTLLFPEFRIVSEVGGYEIMRAGGLAHNAQQLAPYTIVGFIYLYYLLLTKGVKLKYTVPLSAIIMMVFFTGSRIAISLMLLSSILLLFLQKKSNAVILSGVLIFIVSLIVLFNIDIWNNLFAFYDKYFLRGRSENLSTLGHRTILWEFGISKFLESPWIGHGYHNIGPYIGLTRIQQEFMPHNSFLMVALNVGLLGFLPLIILFLRVLYIGTKKLIKGDKDVILALTFVLFGIMGNMVESWILSFGYPAGWVLWLSIAEISLKRRSVRMNYAVSSSVNYQYNSSL